MRIRDPRDFGRVALVIGGESAEREVSLDGGRQVLAALQAQDIAATAVDGVPALLDRIAAGSVDRVFNLLHGRGGEDGSLQGALRCLGVPFTGSGVLGSALSMNKVVSKRQWQSAGLPTAPYHVLARDESADEKVADLGLPLVVKPVSEGSSFGISIVREARDLPAAIALARRYEATIMLERFLGGGEYTVGVLQERALPTVRIRPAREFYDYRAKYEDDATAYDCPAGLTAEEEQVLQQLALDAFRVLGLSGWARIDFLRGDDGDFWLLEANTTPGMTSHSLVPKAAAQLGIGFEELVWRILETSFGEAA